MGGSAKRLMKDHADRHYEGVKQVIPEARRLMLFDYDSDENAFHPGPKEIALFEWQRKNIENYLLLPDAWKRAAAQALNLPEDDLFASVAMGVINDFFVSENLTLPRGQTWQNVSANIFKVVDGKKLLFEDEKALFARLKGLEPSAIVIREKVAGVMTRQEIHQDVLSFFAKLQEVTQAV